MNRIHPTAIIDPKAELETDIEIGPYAVIDANVRLGKGCKVGPHVYITGKTTIGSDNQFFHGCTIGEAPQDIGFTTESHSSLNIGTANVFREHSQVHCSSLEQGTNIGNHNYVMSLAHIPHDVQMGNHVLLIQGCILGGHCIIEDYAYISACVAIHPYIRIGAHAIIGGVTGVVQDVPPYITAQGNRAMAHGLNSIGMKRAGFSPELRKAIKESYNILYIEETSVRMATKRIRQELLLEKYTNQTEICEILEYFVGFIENSKRGIVSAQSQKKAKTKD